MLAFEIDHNGSFIARCCNPKLFGLGALFSLEFSQGNSSDEHGVALKGFEASVVVEGSSLERIGDRDKYHTWIPRSVLGLGSVFEIRICDLPDTTLDVACPISTFPIPNDVHKVPSPNLGLAACISGGKREIFGGSGIFGIFVNVLAVGFLGPNSLGNDAYRTQGKTSGFRVFLRPQATKRENDIIRVLQFGSDRPLSIGDKLVFELVDGVSDSQFEQYQVVL